MSLRPYRVRDVMTTGVTPLPRDACFKEVVRALLESGLGALPVVDDRGRVIGVVSESDLLPKEEFRSVGSQLRGTQHRLPDLAKAGAVRADELMTSPAVTVTPSTTLVPAARFMTRAGVHRLVVVDPDGRPVGMVGRSDLLAVFLRPDREIAEEVRREVVARLFPAQASAVRVEVADGVVTLGGRIRDRALVPVAARRVRAVEGVVDVRFALEPGTDGERRHVPPQRHPDRPADPSGHASRAN